jgi:hypothetical protein
VRFARLRLNESEEILVSVGTPNHCDVISEVGPHTKGSIGI